MPGQQYIQSEKKKQIGKQPTNISSNEIYPVAFVCPRNRRTGIFFLDIE